MISRHWSGRIKPGQEEKYIAYLKNTIIPHLSELPGFQKAAIERRKMENASEFLFISYWRNLDDIKAFAGDNTGVAVVSGKAQAMMVNFDKEVRHYEVVEES